MTNDDPEYVASLERALAAAEEEIKYLEAEVKKLYDLAYEKQNNVPTYMGEPIYRKSYENRG